ncbi:hypothetical protein Tco_0000669 [Tanacetum coccineum]
MDLMISLGQKNTLAEYMILSGTDNRPPMLDKDLYDSWKSQMELYMQNREHRRMILESSLNNVLSIGRHTLDCDMKATNIILQRSSSDIYSHIESSQSCKDYGESSITDARGNHSHVLLRFTSADYDMNIYKMKMEQFQVNTKFLNSLSPEWSKFMTDVKLVKDLHTSNFDQLHAYLKQHELHANEVRIMRERNQDPLAFVANQ